MLIFLFIHFRNVIQEALNRQTYQQFKSYAQQQYPQNEEQQKSLIKQLQDQHYQQYVQQMFQYQLQQQKTPQQSQASPQKLSIKKNIQQNNSKPLVNHNSASSPLLSESQNHPTYRTVGGDPASPKSDITTLTEESKEEGELSNSEAEDNSDKSDGEGSGDEDDEEKSIASAQLWTRKDIKAFKDSICKEGGDGIIKVGHGEVVTVRVPTHPDGTCIFWEFATDGYDIGFGLLFEWTKNPGNQVSVHISESEDEDDEDDDEEVIGSNSVAIDDLEKGQIELSKTNSEDSPCSVILPIYRRDSHEEVYAGSHSYPGKGIYMLKFDNSYSLWRSKTLYYRVYYTR